MMDGRIMGKYVVVIGLFFSLASVSFANGNCAQDRCNAPTSAIDFAFDFPKYLQVGS